MQIPCLKERRRMKGSVVSREALSAGRNADKKVEERLLYHPGQVILPDLQLLYTWGGSSLDLDVMWERVKHDKGRELEPPRQARHYTGVVEL